MDADLFLSGRRDNNILYSLPSNSRSPKCSSRSRNQARNSRQGRQILKPHMLVWRGGVPRDGQCVQTQLSFLRKHIYCAKVLVNDIARPPRPPHQALTGYTLHRGSMRLLSLRIVLATPKAPPAVMLNFLCFSDYL